MSVFQISTRHKKAAVCSAGENAQCFPRFVAQLEVGKLRRQGMESDSKDVIWRDVSWRNK